MHCAAPQTVRQPRTTPPSARRFGGGRHALIAGAPRGRRTAPVRSVNAVLTGRALWSVAQGDALMLLGELPRGSIQAVITDPPYSSGGLFRSDRVRRTGTKYRTRGTSRELPDFDGDSRDQRSFFRWSSLWLGECLRASEAGASICVFTDWRQLATVTDAVQCGGWVLRGIVPWDKVNARPVRGGFRSQAEYIVWGTNGARTKREIYLPGVIRGSVDSRTRRHQTQKPLGVLRELLLICPTGGIVLDPFCGSGSTGVAALQGGYRFIGMEKSDEYAERAQSWLREQDGQLAA